jgi:hypothetical protein
MLAGVIPMLLRVTSVEERLIRCGAWQFDRVTGWEVDDDLGWGPAHGVTGSYLVRVTDADAPPVRTTRRA